MKTLVVWVSLLAAGSLPAAEAPVARPRSGGDGGSSGSSSSGGGSGSYELERRGVVERLGQLRLGLE